MAARSLRWVKEVLSRSMRLQHRHGRGPSSAAGKADVTPEVALLLEQRADLGARLLVHDPATQLVRNLFVIHDELGKGGWAGVQALPMSLVGRALTEAQLLNVQEPSELLTTIIESLRSIKTTAEARVAQVVQEQVERVRERQHAAVPEVTQTDDGDYDLVGRGWIRTVPGGLDLSDRALTPQ